MARGGRALLLASSLIAFGLLVVSSSGGGGGAVARGGRADSAASSSSSDSSFSLVSSWSLLGRYSSGRPARAAGTGIAAADDTGAGDQAAHTARQESVGDRDNADVYPDDHYRHLVHFVQVTDVHVSMYREPERIADFTEFVSDTLLKVIKPPVVIVSGDIVDSLGSSYMSSMQNRAEWAAYRKILDDTNVAEKIRWLDIRGNHDNLNLASINSESNFYRQYSEQGRKHDHSYSYVHEMGDEKIAFIGVDTCMDPGSRRPFNFFGQITSSRYDELLRLKHESSRANYTIWFGHHPSSVVFASSNHGYVSVRSLFQNSGPYLCGHYHTVFNMVPHMYTLHTGNALELELGDFKKDRKFRVLSIDHGLLNFIDVRFREYPIILVTNPKNALFHLPEYEPISRIGRSSHIRVLVFSDEPIVEVKVQINSENEEYLLQVDKTPLFVLPWQPSNYSKGLHQIRVVAEDGLGRIGEVAFKFSTDGSRPAFPFLAQLVLAITREWFIVVVLLVVSVTVSLLTLLRWRHARPFGREGRSPIAAVGTLLSDPNNIVAARGVRRFCVQMALLASVNRLFYPVIFLPLFVLLGPWFVGAIVENSLGAVFLWGLFTNGTALPGGIIFFYATLYLLVYYAPFVCLLSTRVHTTFVMHFLAMSPGAVSHNSSASVAGGGAHCSSSNSSTSWLGGSENTKRATHGTTSGSSATVSASAAHHLAPHHRASPAHHLQQQQQQVAAEGNSKQRSSLRQAMCKQRLAVAVVRRRSCMLFSPLLRSLRAMCLFVLVAFQLLWASWFWFAFGWIALFSPLPTGAIIFSLVMWRIASTLPRSKFRCLAMDSAHFCNLNLSNGFCDERIATVKISASNGKNNTSSFLENNRHRCASDNCLESLHVSSEETQRALKDV